MEVFCGDLSKVEVLGVLKCLVVVVVEVCGCSVSGEFGELIFGCRKGFIYPYTCLADRMWLNNVKDWRQLFTALLAWKHCVLIMKSLSFNSMSSTK